MSADEHEGHDPHRRLRSTTFWLVRSTGRTLERAIHRRFDAVGLSTRYGYGILATLDDQGPAAQAEIGRRVNVDPSDIVAALNEMERLGQVRRERDPDDRRRNRVQLTDAGRTLLGVLEREIAAAEDEVLAALDGAERATLRALLERLG